jgi:hypothetical protein
MQAWQSPRHYLPHTKRGITELPYFTIVPIMLNNVKSFSEFSYFLAKIKVQKSGYKSLPWSINWKPPHYAQEQK